MYMRICSFFCLILLFVGCYKTEVVKTEEVYDEPPTVIIEETNVVSDVIDQNGSQVDGEIIFNNQTVINTGFNTFEGNYIKKYGTLLEVKQTNGLLFGMNLLNLENQINYHQVIIPSDFQVVTYGQEALQIPISDRHTLEIGASALYKDGVLVSEDLNILYKTLDANQLYSYPLNKTVHEQTQTFLAFDEVFYLALGESAHANYMAPGTWSMNHTKALYFFDHEHLQWRLVTEDDALKSGYYGVGQGVKGHFVEMAFTGDGVFENFQVECTIDDQFVVRAQTTSASKAIIFVPEDAALSVSLKHSGMSIFQEEVQSDKTAYSFLVPGSKFVRVYTEVIDCAMKSVPNAILHQSNEKWNNRYWLNGRKELLIYVGAIKTHQFSMQVLNQKSKAQIYEVRDPLILGKQLYCEDAFQDYVIVESESGFQVFRQIEFELSGNYGIIKAQDGEEVFWIKFYRKGVGTYQDEDVNYYLKMAASLDYTFNCFGSKVGCGTEVFEMQHYNEETGSLIKGFFNGTYWISSVKGSNVGYRTLSGSFQFYLP